MKLDRVLENPLVTDFHRHTWEFSFVLEKAGIFTSHKADNIRRRHLTVAWSKKDSVFYDLLYPASPRKGVQIANKNLIATSNDFYQKVLAGGIHSTHKGQIPNEILKSPNMEPFLSLFPNFTLGDTELFIYGERGDSSFWYHRPDDGKRVIAVSPDLYGLPTLLVDTSTDTFSLGIYPLRIGYAFIMGCHEILAREGHPAFIGVAGFIEEICLRANEDAVPLAKQLVLGNPSPLFSALEKGGGPLAPALLTYISHSANNTPGAIARIDVMRTLNL